MEKSGHPGKINYSALLKDLGFDPDDFEIVDSRQSSIRERHDQTKAGRAQITDVWQPRKVKS